MEGPGGGAPRTRGGVGWIARPPKSRFLKTNQTPLELGKCLVLGNGKGLGTGKHKHMGKGKDTGQVGRMTHSRRRAKRGGGYYSQPGQLDSQIGETRDQNWNQKPDINEWMIHDKILRSDKGLLAK